ncbi:MAG TPA: ATP-binding cassette domain-containing protein [Rubrobacter sp.]|jgi:simple sugar transport system ATP-binding protein|nr:ATP-binding cassette domain-containing protein [Rubrobacter sp.]
MMTNDAPLLEARGISKYFGHVVALEDISMDVRPGEVMCLLGDNGAGKSSLIKTFSGVHQPDKGTLLLEGEETIFNSPRDAIDHGIATVYQDLAMIPLSGISRNFFLGREPTKGKGPFKMFDVAKADRITREELSKIGIELRDTSQPVATLSGGERQSVAIARAIHFGAKVLILDEPTSALGVKQAAIVLRYIAHAKEQGLGIIFISHNVYHAHPIGDRFTVLERGRSIGTFKKDEISIEELERLMAGGAELEELSAELQGSRPAGSEGSAKGTGD